MKYEKPSLSISGQVDRPRREETGGGEVTAFVTGNVVFLLVPRAGAEEEFRLRAAGQMGVEVMRSQGVWGELAPLHGRKRARSQEYPAVVGFAAMKKEVALSGPPESSPLAEPPKSVFPKDGADSNLFLY